MNPAYRMVRLRWLLIVPCMAAVLLASSAFGGDAGAGQWYRGNTHGHTHWSDGDELPELVVDWFKNHGYQFLALSDHEKLMERERWASLASGKRPVSPESIENTKQRFGVASVVMRKEGEERQVKLKTFAELSAQFNEPGKFLLVPNEEIATNVNGAAIHMNAINVAECLAAKRGKDMAETIQLSLSAVQDQAARLHRPMLSQVNHPNFPQFDVPAEDIAQATAANFFEVCNGHPSVHNSGDATHPSTDKIWDVANTIRIAKMKTRPLYGIGADDSHNYHKFAPKSANPGRAWIMVRAQELSADALLAAMNHGDFYATTGVILRDVVYDPKERVYKVEVQPEPGTKHTVEFVGTLQGADPTCELLMPAADTKVKRPGRKYAPEVGKVLAVVQDESAAYKLTGKELYVRAVVRSDKPMANPINDDVTMQQAWCQPVGWEAK